MALTPMLQFPYEDKAFQESWHKHLAPKFPLDCLDKNFALLKRKKMLGVPLLKQLRIPGWNSSWAQDLTECHAQILSHKIHQKSWSVLTFKWAQSRKKLQAIPTLRKKGFVIFNSKVDDYYVVDTSRGWDTYLKQHSKSRQKDIKRQLKKAEKNNYEFVYFDGEDGIQQFFSQFFPAHIRYWKEKNGSSFFSDPREQRFFIEWCRTLEQQGKLRLMGLKLNQSLCFLSMDVLSDEDTYLALLSITVGKQEKLAPGIIATYLQVKMACDNNIKVFNMGPGYHLYKSQIATHTEPCYETTVINTVSIRGRLYQGYYMLKSWLMRRRKSQNKGIEVPV